MFFFKIPSIALNTVEVTLMFSGYPFFPFLNYREEVCFSVVICYQLAALLKILAAGHAISCASSFRTQGWRLSCPSNFSALSSLSFSSTSHMIISISISSFIYILHFSFLDSFIFKCLAKQFLLGFIFIIKVL